MTPAMQKICGTAAAAYAVIVVTTGAWWAAAPLAAAAFVARLAAKAVGREGDEK